MSCITVIRSGAAAALAACAIGLPAQAAPAGPAAPSAAAVAAKQEQPSASILIGQQWEPGKTGALVLAGQSPTASLRLQIPGGSAYTDLHFKTSHPGSASGCTMKALYSSLATQRTEGSAECLITLPALRADQTLTYSVTFWGKRDGKPFSVTDAFSFRGVGLTVRHQLGGKDVTGTTVYVPHAKTPASYTVTNTGRTTVRAVRDAHEYTTSRCTFATLAPGETRTCRYTMADLDIKLAEGKVDLATVTAWMDVDGPAGYYGALAPRTGTRILVRAGARLPSGEASDASAPDAPAPPLAETGLPVGATLAAGLGLIGLGAVTRRCGRR